MDIDKESQPKSVSFTSEHLHLVYFGLTLLKIKAFTAMLFAEELFPKEPLSHQFWKESFFLILNFYGKILHGAGTFTLRV